MNVDAELLSRRAALSQDKVDVTVAEADLDVARSEERLLQAWVNYLVLPAPFDGVIVARNANTFDFVLPSTGDPSAFRQGPYLSPSGSAAPIYKAAPSRSPPNPMDEAVQPGGKIQQPMPAAPGL